tara:strand:+ start:2660 stop:3454 length:795 start_codon:yes stop_codon:yes gene_type:complete
LIEKVGHVKNPLTIIAIFAALAEVGGTIVLPLLEPITQYIYVWFLMLFPIGLVGVFFYVLYHKHHVLYAPSDFKEDTSFLDLLDSQSASERLASLEKEAGESVVNNSIESTESDDTISALDIMQRDYRAKYLLAEELAIAKIAKERSLIVRRGVRERGTSDPGFDGAAETEAHDFIIEVSYNRKRSPAILWRHKIERLKQFYDRLPDARKSRFRVIFIIVYGRDIQEGIERTVDTVRRISKDLPFSTEVIYYCYDDLADEFNLK